MFISKYETERSMPNMENLGKLARALDVTVDYMVFDNVPRNGRVELMI
jgi:transcriptional regulator with XRE-family HTH domain